MVTRTALMALMRDVFESQKDAEKWWRAPHPMLNGRSPAATARSQRGAEQVRDILISLRFGGVV